MGLAMAVVAVAVAVEVLSYESLPAQWRGQSRRDEGTACNGGRIGRCSYPSAVNNG